MKLTPGMKQYMDVKNKHPDCIVLFRMGDFYEVFFEDAKTVARELDITLTERGQGETKAPLAGIPYHSIEPYIAKLVRNGHKLAIVEQTEDPKKAKGIVKRDVVRIITKGTVFESLILDEKTNNYLLSFTKDNNKYGISLCDVSTGEFLTTELEESQFLNELKRISPAEIIFPMSLENSQIVQNLKDENYITHSFDDRFFYYEKSQQTLKEHFQVINMKGFGNFSEMMLSSSGALLSYLKQTHENALNHINSLNHYQLDKYMHLDSSTIRNLELTRNPFSNSEDSTLVSVLDKTTTPMGKRLIRKWVVLPLKEKEEIKKRSDAVENLKENLMLRSSINEKLKKVTDVERLIGRVSFGNANPKDLISLKHSLKEIPSIKDELSKSQDPMLKELSQLPDLEEPKRLIEDAIKEEPNTTVREGNIIKQGYSKELDELKEITYNGKSYLAELEEKEKNRTGIKSLKIKYNKVFGYFIEVTKANLHLVPDDYIRKQTQVNAERYITEELKEKETKILGAEERSIELEYDIFINILEQLRKYINSIQDTSKKLATLDCLISLSNVAENMNYVKPEISEEGVMDLRESRHPVIEAFSEVDFVPNDCYFDNQNRMRVITGPNMAGKSTYMRQVALISLMTQIGSFVPASYAKLPLFDKIFTRVGAYDDLVSGQSTFMVEMNETANILNNATQNSLIILDEIGRGTSTYDGLSLAWAVAEYIYTKIQAKSLFSTHYHHLNKLADQYEGVNNFNIAVEEKEDDIVFLRKIHEGGTDNSYGIQVANLAGVPKPVIESSKKVMNEITKETGEFEVKKENEEKKFKEVEKIKKDKKLQPLDKFLRK